MRKAVIITGKSVQDHEYIYPYYRLQEAGYEVDVAVDDCTKEVLTYNGIKVLANRNIKDLDYVIYDLLVLPGGAKAMEYLRQDRVLFSFIKSFHESGKIIASICHGAQLMISANIVEGNQISGYYSIKDDINNAGATFVDAPAVVSDKIVSSPHYKYLGQWMKAVLEEVER
jgi:protease I